MKTVILQRPQLRYVNTRPKRTVQVRALNTELDMVQMSQTFGTGITAFVFFYTSLNWWFYKREREELKRFYSMPDKKKKTQDNQKTSDRD